MRYIHFPWRPPGSDHRRGAVLVLVAFMLPLFLVILTFSINIAYMQLVRTEMRAATDASAKAAAAGLARSLTQAEARQLAIDIAAENMVAGEGLVLTPTQVEFGGALDQGDGTFGFDSGASVVNTVRVNSSRTSTSAQGATDLLMTGFLGTSIFEPVQTATATYADVDFCLVLDRSSSMKLATTDAAAFMSGGDPRECDPPWADSRWVALDNAVNVFCDMLDTTSPVENFAIVTYASDHTQCGVTVAEASIDLNLTANTTSGRSTMTVLSSSVWHGNTNIYAGIQLGQNVLTGALSRPHAKKIMIVLTDGNYTGNDPAGAAAVAATHEITIHTVTFSVGANQTMMQSVASAGGGDHYHAPDAATLNQIFRFLAARPATLIE